MTARAVSELRVLSLSGGVGGAKLARGLSAVVEPGKQHVLVNTGDDFEHLGLTICPDIDTLLYTLGGVSDTQRGWGRASESWQMLETLGELGGDTWFQLGDRDLATHLLRSARLAAGSDLLQVTDELASALGIPDRIHPMSADTVATTVHASEGDLPFQHYFVREQCRPEVNGFSFRGIDRATPNPEVMAMLAARSFDAIVVCPSNPFVSIDPILRLPGLYQALLDSGVPVTLVSPIVAGLAIKGPAAKMMSELGMPVTALGVAQHYHKSYPGLVKYFVLDDSDATLAPEMARLGMEAVVLPTVMRTDDDKRALAAGILELYRD